MASYKDILKEKDNQNWLKGSLALKITKAGLRGLVEGDSRLVQQKIHSSVLQARHLTVGTTCSRCLTENLLQCPTKGLCTIPRNCQYHNTPFKIYQNCPSQICDDFRDKIRAVHRYSGPSWKNTKADQWCTNHWQVAKCFMPPEGYLEVTSYDETDFNGIISVMINCTEFQRRLSFTIGNQPDTLSEARVIGRKIRHSSELKVTDTDLADYFTTLNALLTDSKFLASDKDAQQAVIKLKQLEKDALPISTEDVNELLEEARATIEAGKSNLKGVVSQGKTAIEAGKRQLAESTEAGMCELKAVLLQGKTALEAGKRQLETGKSELEGVVSQGKTVIEADKRQLEAGKSELEGVIAQGKTAIEAGNREIVEAVSQGKAVLESESRRLEEKVSEGQVVLEAGKHQLEDATQTGKDELEGVVSQGKRQLEDAVSTTSGVTKRAKLEIEDAVAKSRDVVQVGKQELKEALQKIKAFSFMSEAEQREDLRQRLVKYYQKQLNRAPISPLLSKKDERLCKIYVSPNIVKNDHRRFERQHNVSPISTYKQIFCRDEKLANTVFVIGEAGMGKSAFSAMCTIRWAAQFSISMRDSGEKSLDEDEEEKKFFADAVAKEIYVRKDYQELLRKDYQELLRSLSRDDKPYVNSYKDTFCELLSHPMNDLLQDEDTLKDIEFMFYIKLRDCCETCELSDMIRDQLINIVYRPDERAAGYLTMISVLSNRKCVIIADGLDEWSHPAETYCSCSLEDKAIPNLSQTLDATVLITSRPWRMSQNRVNDNKIGKYLEMKGVACTQLLVKKTLVSLNVKEAEERRYLDFIRFVARGRLVRLLSVPIIVLLLVCLWFEVRHDTLSLCDVYAYILEMMFGRKSLPVLGFSLERIERTPLQCFKQTEHVQMYYNILLKLAQLAFEKLFSRDRKASLVFQNVDCLTQEELLFVLKSGIMRETKSQSLIRKSSRFSFIHKTVQEFLASVHIAHHTEEIQKVLKLKYHEAFKEYVASEYSTRLSDVFQVFIYMCGLNSEVAQDISAMMSFALLEQDFQGDIIWHCNLIDEVQGTFCSGYREAKANNVQNIQLHLMSLYITDLSIDLSTLKILISMSKFQIRHITIHGQEVEISEEELQEVFISSKDTLIRVEMIDRVGQYDLSACCRLQYLSLQSPLTSNISINTNSLVELKLNDVSEKVESSILQSLEPKCEQLMIFSIGLFKNIGLFCKTLPRLSHLKEIKIDYTTLGDHKLLLPPFVNDVHLNWVTMSARCLRELVERVENCSHTVNCYIDECIVEPVTDYEDIKQNTQSRNTVHFVDLS